LAPAAIVMREVEGWPWFFSAPVRPAQVIVSRKALQAPSMLFLVPEARRISGTQLICCARARLLQNC